MVEQFTLNPALTMQGSNPLKNELRKRIRDRVLECDVPDCWILRDPRDDGQICLKRKFFNTQPRGRCVQIRQVLFQMTFRDVPPIGRIIRMNCAAPRRCINPAHYSVAGWRITLEDSERLKNELKWITQEQIDERSKGKAGRPYAPWYSAKLEEARRQEAEAKLNGMQ